jgi:hypothetical protein
MGLKAQYYMLLEMMLVRTNIFWAGNLTIAIDEGSRHRKMVSLIEHACVLQVGRVLGQIRRFGKVGSDGQFVGQQNRCSDYLC